VPWPWLWRLQVRGGRGFLNLLQNKGRVCSPIWLEEGKRCTDGDGSNVVSAYPDFFSLSWEAH